MTLRPVRRFDSVCAVAVLVTLAGCTARFVHLSEHFYFHDEASTSLRVSGHTSADFAQFVTRRGGFTAAQIRAFQEPSGRGLTATVRSLATNDPQHPPLFYVLARLWADPAGASITALRSLSALLGVLALAAAGWLVWELFGSWRIAWIAVALLAISPFQILYSQEAREYSLWVATVAVASAALLAALRTGSDLVWIVYCTALIAALYTFPNTVLVALGHAAFVLLDARRRSVLVRFGAASAAACLAFMPWVAVMVLERGALRAGTDWTASGTRFTDLLRSWLVVFGLGVVDKKGEASSLGTHSAVLFGAVAIVEVASLVVVCRRARRQASFFVMSLTGATALPLILADVTVGGVRSTIPRFLAPTYLGLTIALAFLISQGLDARRQTLRAAVALVALSVAAAGAFSYVESARAPVWWNQDDGAAAENLAVSHALNRLDQPLLISTGMGTLLEMSHYLRPGIHVQVVVDGRLPQLRDGFGETVVYGSPANGAAAARLAFLLRDIRRRHAGALRPVTLRLPCCGDGIRPIANQVWTLGTPG